MYTNRYRKAVEMTQRKTRLWAARTRDSVEERERREREREREKRFGRLARAPRCSGHEVYLRWFTLSRYTVQCVDARKKREREREGR